MIPCAVCKQKLYPLERMTLNSKVYHKNGCAKCSTCNTNLTVSNFAMVGDKLFCKTHYMANFSRSGGRYSFSLDQSTEETTIQDAVRPVSSKPVSSAGSSVGRVQSVPVTTSSTAPAKVNKLATFLATAAKDEVKEPQSTPPKKSTTVCFEETPKPLKADPIAFSQVKPQQTIASSSKPLGAGENKFAAFLSGGASMSQQKPLERKVEEKIQAPSATGYSEVERAPRPVSLKERIALYSSEASKVREPERARPVEHLVPSVPTKDPSLRMAAPPRPIELATPVRKLSSENSRLPSSSAPVQRKASTCSQAPASENKLTAFLKAAESPAPSVVSQPVVPQQSVTYPALPPNKPSPTRTRQPQHFENVETETHRERPKSLKERIAAYSSEVSKSSASSTFKPLEVKDVSELPSPPSFSTPQKQSSIGRTSSQREERKQPPESAMKGGISLQERIAAYQARASGRQSSSGIFKTPTKKGSGTQTPLSSNTKESPTKKGRSFRNRFPMFLRSSSATNVAPSSKPSELTRTLRKICEEGVGQISRASVKDVDANQDLKNVALDLLDAFEQLMNKLDDLEEARIPMY